MQILQLTRDYPPLCKGGISTAVGGMVQSLKRHGVSSAVISFDGWRPRARNPSAVLDPTPVVEQGVPVLRVAAPEQLRCAERFADQIEPTHIHVHHEMLWEFAQRVLARRRAATLLTVHVVQAKLDRLRGLSASTLSARAQETALRQADRIIAPSPAAAEALLQDDPTIAPRLVQIGLGIEDSADARRSVDDRRDKTRAAGEAVELLYVGRFADVNGTRELFELINRLAPRLPQLRFTIAGGIPGNSRGERRWLERWRRSGTPEAISRTRLLGWVTPEQLPALYRGASALISPSWFETFGLTVLEAMLHGVPIAATRSGGVEQLLRHEHSGLLSPSRDMDSLAEQVERLLTDCGEAQRLGLAAASDCRQRWLWSNVTPDLVGAYHFAARLL
jgi:glycosyltransferase involved in cell wall biosynthesis